MIDQSQVAATLGDASLPLADWLISLRRRGELLPLLREAVIEQF